jgi:imidazolonepropionase-like amidohydrolase
MKGLSPLASIGLGLVLLGCGAPRPAAQVRRPADPPDAVLLRDAAVLDVAGAAVQRGRDVLLREGRIAKIEPTGSLQAPHGALEIDAAGATLVPGLVDMHGHLNVDPAPAWDRATPDLDANLQAYLYAGVTTLMDPGDGSGEAFSRRDRVAAGERLGPHIYTAGPILTVTGGHPRAMVSAFAPWWIEWYLLPRVATAVDSEQEAAAIVDELAEQDADIVKIAIDAIPLDAPRMPPEIAAAIVSRARSHGIRTVAHIGTLEDAIEAADAGVALWAHGVYKERLLGPDVVKLAKYGIPMVVTLEVFHRYARAFDGPRVATALERELAPASLLDSFYPVPDDFDPGPLRSWLELMAEQRDTGAVNALRLHRAGVTILAGSDAQSGVFPGAGLHRELAQLVRISFSPMEAIRAATLDPALFLANGEEPEFGSIAVGKRADLLLVDGDPSQDIGAIDRIRQVFLEGVPLERVPVAAVAAGAGQG